MGKKNNWGPVLEGIKKVAEKSSVQATRLSARTGGPEMPVSNEQQW